MGDVVGYVYKTTNLVNGKVYVGQHQRSALDRLYYGSGKIIAAALKKYGKQAFRVEVLSWETSQERLDEAERHFIAAFDARNPKRGYNLSHGGHIGFRGQKHTEDAKRKIGIASRGNQYSKGATPWNKGVPLSEERKQRLSEQQKGKPLPGGATEAARKVNTGRKLSEEHKRKVSQSSMGKQGTRNGVKLTEETKRKISEANKGKHSAPWDPSRKAVLWSAARRAAHERKKLRMVS